MLPIVRRNGRRSNDRSRQARAREPRRQGVGSGPPEREENRREVAPKPWQMVLGRDARQLDLRAHVPAGTSALASRRGRYIQIAPALPSGPVGVEVEGAAVLGQGWCAVILRNVDRRAQIDRG